MSVISPASAVIDVGVLGSINEDIIEQADGRIDHGLGGVLFTACALGYLGVGSVRVWLLAKAHDGLVPRLRERLAPVPGLRLDGLIGIPQPGYRCHIVYGANGEKSEVLHGGVEPLTAVELAPFLPRLQALVVNFITGFEITSSDLATVRRSVNGPVFMDLHSLTLGREADGTRFPDPAVDVTQWLAAADVVQMNEAEARILGAPVEIDGSGNSCASSLLTWAERLLDHGPRAIVITRGAAGSVAAWRSTEGVIFHERQPAHRVDRVEILDTTGCGDVFLAAMAAAQVQGLGLSIAMERASRAAACNCQISGIDELHRLPLK